MIKIEVNKIRMGYAHLFLKWECIGGCLSVQEQYFLRFITSYPSKMEDSAARAKMSKSSAYRLCKKLVERFSDVGLDGAKNNPDWIRKNIQERGITMVLNKDGFMIDNEEKYDVEIRQLNLGDEALRRMGR